VRAVAIAGATTGICALVFIAFQSDEAQRRFSRIDALKPGEQLLVVSDKGAVYPRCACMDRVSLGTRELSGTRATLGASSFAAAGKPYDASRRCVSAKPHSYKKRVSQDTAEVR